MGPSPLPLYVMSRQGKAKRFSQWTPTNGGLWLDRNPLKTLPLFRLPQIKNAEKVVVVEGEKCVQAVLDALAQHGCHDLRRR